MISITIFVHKFSTGLRLSDCLAALDLKSYFTAAKVYGFRTEKNQNDTHTDGAWIL